MTGVIEAPGALGYQTSYTYNALDDLTLVTQASQSRSFVYDALKRLSSSLQPEMDPQGQTSKLAASYRIPTTDWFPRRRTATGW